MSNCINIVHGWNLNFTPKEIDILGFRDLMKRAEANINQNNCVSEDADRDEQMAWWFLSRNSTIDNKGTVIILLGTGRSSHTWRDFQGTLQVISTLIKKAVELSFQITNEYDNYKTMEHYKVVLSPNAFTFIE